jgi:hypothetical protein
MCAAAVAAVAGSRTVIVVGTRRRVRGVMRRWWKLQAQLRMKLLREERGGSLQHLLHLRLQGWLWHCG